MKQFSFVSFLLICLLLISYPSSILSQDNYGISVERGLFHGTTETFAANQFGVFHSDGAKLYYSYLNDRDELISDFRLELPGTPSGMEMNKNWLYIAIPKFGLYIYYTQFSMLSFNAHYKVDEFYSDVFYREDYLYFTSSGGVKVFGDVNSAEPILVGQINTESFPRDLEIKDGIAYVADYNDIYVVDVSDKSDLIHLDTLYSGYITDLLIVDNKLYAGGYENLLIYDISVPAGPVLINDFEIHYAAYIMAEKDSILYTSGHGNITTYDISTDLEMIDNSRNHGYVTKMDFLDDKLICANLHKGLEVRDVEDPEEIDLVAAVANNSYSFEILPYGDYFYVANYDEGLTIYQESGDETFELVAQVDDVHSTRALDIIDGYLYLADFENGFRIANISDPVNPDFVGSIDDEGNVYEFDVKDEIAYLAMDSRGLHIYDISDKSHPLLLSTVETEERVVNVHVYDDLAVVSNHRDGVLLVDVSDPSTPEVINGFKTDPDNEIWVGLVYDAEIQDQYLFFTDHSYGFQIVDISDLEDLEKVTTVWTRGRPYDLELKGNYLYVALAYGGIKIYDITDITDPVEVAFYLSGGEIRDIKVVDQYVYAADYNCGIIQFNAWSTTSVDPVKEHTISVELYPNPANYQSTLKIDSEHLSDIHILVIDRNGKVLNKVLIPNASNQTILCVGDVMHHVDRQGLYYIQISTEKESTILPVIWTNRWNG